MVAAFANIPRFGDQLDIGQHRILMDNVEERRQPVDGVQFPRQRRGQVEAEAIDMHLQHPVAQAVHDQLEHLRMADIERIAAAGEIHVVARVVLDQAVIGGIVHPAQSQGRPHLVAFTGVVVNHIQNHLDAGAVQRLDHLLELAHLLALVAAGAVAGVGGKEIQRIVTPIVAQPGVREVARMSEVMMHRHQFDRSHVDRAQMRDGGGMRQAGVSAA